MNNSKNTNWIQTPKMNGLRKSKDSKIMQYKTKQKYPIQHQEESWISFFFSAETELGLTDQLTGIIFWTFVKLLTLMYLGYIKYSIKFSV